MPDYTCICEDVDSKHRFDYDGGKWCCSNNCTEKEYDSFRYPKTVSCKGTALNLTQQCNSSCNFYQHDEWTYISMLTVMVITSQSLANL